MAGVLDEPGGNPGAQLSAQVHERRKVPYAWTCPNPMCRAANMGYVEDGCPVCGAGRDAVQREPARPVDYQCRACRGQGTVDRKCGECQGTGAVAPPQEGQPPEDCRTCGGAGVVARDCARCGGTGIDPEPQVVAQTLPGEVPQEIPPAVGGTVPPLPANSGQAGIFGARAEDRSPAQPQLERGTLPSLDDSPLTPAATVVRYRLLRYEGSPEDVAEVIDRSLHGTQVHGGVVLTGIEIASPKPDSAVARHVEDRLRAGDGVWPVKQRDYYRG